MAKSAETQTAGPGLKETAALIVTSDTHENHIYGLGPPVFTKDSGDEVRANPIRRELWDLWGRFWDGCLEATKDVPRVAVLLGDIIESDAKVRSPQDLVTQSPADAFRMVTETLDPVLQECAAALFIRGTEAHVGLGAWQEEQIAANYDHAIRDGGNASWWHFYGELGGVVFDIAHHASMSGIRRNAGSAAGALAFDVMTEYIVNWQQKPPDYVIRAHNHRFADSGMTFPTRALFTGCFQYKSTFTHRINKSYEMPNLGGLVLICDRGKSELIPARIKPKKKVLWRSK